MGCCAGPAPAAGVVLRLGRDGGADDMWWSKGGACGYLLKSITVNGKVYAALWGFSGFMDFEKGGLVESVSGLRSSRRNVTCNCCGVAALSFKGLRIRSNWSVAST